MVEINWWTIQPAWTESCADQNSSVTWRAQELLGILVQQRKSAPRGSPTLELWNQIPAWPVFWIAIPVTFWPIFQCFTLDEGVCLWGKGLCCPGRVGEEVVGVLLPICQCTHTVIGANRPEEPSPAGPRGGRGLQSHRLWGNDRGHLTNLATLKLIASAFSYKATLCV